MKRPMIFLGTDEQRLIRRSPEGYAGQWFRETTGYQIVKPAKGLGALVTAPVNTIGKIGLGASTAVDRLIFDNFANPNPPVSLDPNALLPRTQRDVNQLVENLGSENLVRKPIRTLLATAPRILGVGTSMIADGLQKLGGGKN